MHEIGAYWRFIRQRIAMEQPGWTLDYIDTLTQGDVADFFAVRAAYRKSSELDKA